VPRRHWDITFSQAPFGVEFSPAVDLVIGVMALGGLLAVVGGASYILITVTSVFFGRRLEASESGRGAHAKGLPLGLISPPRALVAGDEAALAPHALGIAPGTMVLVGVFLAAFITYYFVNWKLLSAVWKIG
jgi:cytochrome c oxidase subunit 1